jgi:hypothetical protein
MLHHMHVPILSLCKHLACAPGYHTTPTNLLTGLAIREFWGVDDTSIVFVADPTFGDILNFNVGQSVDLEVPQVRALRSEGVLSAHMLSTGPRLNNKVGDWP